MPYSVNLNQCSFSLDKKNQLLLELYKKACDLYFKNKSLEERSITDLAISDNQLKKGFVAKVINAFEKFNEERYGASFVTLNQIDNIKLDPEADKMRDTFIKIVNDVFIRNGMTSKDLSREKHINSAALVFRQLLLRLVTIALCNDNTYVRDGETLLKVYSYFVDQVICHIDQFPSEEKIFCFFATKEHVEAMNSLNQVVLTIKLIHSHHDNITECLTTLKNLTRNIEAMILAHLVLANAKCDWPFLTWVLSIAPHIRISDLTEQSIEGKLNQYEQFLDSKNSDKNSDNIKSTIKNTGITTYTAIAHLGHSQHAKSILDVKDIAENSHIAALIACKNNNCPQPLFEKLELLYNLYFKSRCLLISLEQIDDLITTCSWVPIVMGLIDLSKICELMRLHCDICAQTLAISNNDVTTSLPFKQAILHKAFRVQSQLQDMQQKILALEDLQNPAKIQKIKHHISKTITNLFNVQSVLEISLLQYKKHKGIEKKEIANIEPIERDIRSMVALKQ